MGGGHGPGGKLHGTVASNDNVECVNEWVWKLVAVVYENAISMSQGMRENRQSIRAQLLVPSNSRTYSPTIHLLSTTEAEHNLSSGQSLANFTYIVPEHTSVLQVL